MPATKKQTPINLLPNDDYPQTLWGRILTWLLTTFRFMVIGVELFVIVGFLSRFFLDTQNADLSDEINQKKGFIESYLPFEKQFKLTQNQIEVFKTSSQTTIENSELLKLIAQNLTSSVRLDSYLRKGDTVDIKLVSSTESSIASFIKSITTDTRIQSVFVSQVENQTNEARYVFTVRIAVAPI